MLRAVCFSIYHSLDKKAKSSGSKQGDLPFSQQKTIINDLVRCPNRGSAYPAVLAREVSHNEYELLDPRCHQCIRLSQPGTIRITQITFN